jgi:periplasmic divalent cation tolerance protein
MPNETEILLLLTTFPSLEAAECCASALLEQRAAACVQVEGPLVSHYVWKDRREKAEEWRLTAKTTHAAAPACRAVVRQQHAYDLPEVLLIAARADVEYARWVEATVTHFVP